MTKVRLLELIERFEWFQYELDPGSIDEEMPADMQELEKYLKECVENLS